MYEGCFPPYQLNSHYKEIATCLKNIIHIVTSTSHAVEKINRKERKFDDIPCLHTPEVWILFLSSHTHRLYYHWANNLLMMIRTQQTQDTCSCFQQNYRNILCDFIQKNIASYNLYLTILQQYFFFRVAWLDNISKPDQPCFP